jgi:hypothetical protein
MRAVKIDLFLALAEYQDFLNEEAAVDTIGVQED